MITHLLICYNMTHGLLHLSCFTLLDDDDNDGDRNCSISLTPVRTSTTWHDTNVMMIWEFERSAMIRLGPFRYTNGSSYHGLGLSLLHGL